MTTWADIRERYLQDDIRVRLGGLAAIVLRISSHSDRLEHRDAVSRLARESALCIEWTAPDVEADRQAELAQLQLESSTRYRDCDPL
jgi:hypothetical protein